jgi:hypothetical protein
MSWSRAFYDPIPLPRCRQLVTLKDAAEYIQKLPKPEQDLKEWQAAGRSPALGRRAQRTNHDGAHWHTESIEPTPRAGVQSRSQRHPLGKAEA